RAFNPEQAARGANAKPALTTCPECKAIRRQGQPCPECGWRPRPKPRPVDVIDGDLVLVGSAKEPWTLAQRQQVYRELLGHARRKGWRDGAAAYKFREKFGVLPPWSWRNLGPAAPSPATQAWLRSRAIAYAKAQARRAG